MKSFLSTLFLISIFFSCSVSRKDESDTRIATDRLAPLTETSETDERVDNGPLPPPRDTSYFCLAKLLRMPGEILLAKLVTDRFLNASDIVDERRLHVFIFDYNDDGPAVIGEREVFGTTYSTLAVFEEVDNHLQLIDHTEIPHSRNAMNSRYTCTSRAEELWLTDEKVGILASVRSESELTIYGNGSADKGSLFVLLNNKLTEVLSITLEDYFYVTDESNEYSESHFKASLVTLESDSNGLFDLKCEAQTQIKSSDGYRQEPSSTGSVKTDELEDGIRKYKWNGTLYERIQ